MKKNITAKKVKVMCSVPGCINRNTYNLTRTRFSGNTIICEDCLKEAWDVIGSGEEPPPDTGIPAEFKCPKCGKVYKTSLNLAKHVKSCEGTQPPSTSLTPPSGKGADGENDVDNNGGEGENQASPERGGVTE